MAREGRGEGARIFLGAHRLSLPMSRPLLSRPALAVLARMAVAYAAWFALYDLWLLPEGRLDAAVGRSAALLAGAMLRAVGLGATVEGLLVRAGGPPGVIVDEGCTGLEVVGLFVGFVLAFPGSWRRRALFVPLGALAIHLLNAARIGFLAWLLRVQPSLFEPAHQWGTPLFFYAAVFLMWVAWMHLGAARPAPEPAPA